VFFHINIKSELLCSGDYTLLTPWNATHFQLNRNFRELNRTQEVDTEATSHAALVIVYSSLHSAGALLGIEVRS
jgi:hypothetical protein